MTTFLLVLGMTGTAMALMAVGVIFSNRKLHGSCGGSGEDCVCEIEKRRACHALKELAKRRAHQSEVQALLAQGGLPQTDAVQLDR